MSDTSDYTEAHDQKSVAQQEEEPKKQRDDLEGREDDDDDEPIRFPPEQEASLLAEANGYKADANALFARSPEAALTTYETAVAVLPEYLYYDVAVLRSNMAACHLKLEAWKEAIRTATEAVEALDKDEAKTARDAEKRQKAKSTTTEETTTESRSKVHNDADEKEAEAEKEEEADEEIVSAGAATAAKPPPRAAAKDQEVGDMMGKLKELGNGLLRPFGISTENFQMVKDEKTGGYSLNFQQGRGS
ncbi:tetratricopeptide repeat protein 1 (TTC1) [Niveomyces insectorum RCEF 264]|uniref:Tetratricopeptide repeat protein 1 (TTC1) n=1 Tax=Niveomyces insectorum RCEF 264 TaxID=1081102 RepID=A0A168A697_9HYPO|nr:tetratricopeptide repeat protein 1 (TTC1) [Niveomyces insectorum RCEF 264]